MTNPEDITTYLAIDIETTGLDPVNGAILEVAAKILDADLRTINAYHSTIECSRSMLLAMDPFVIDMHKATGLLQYKTPGRPFIADGRPIAEVYRELHEMVSEAFSARTSQLIERDSAEPTGKPLDARLIPLGASLHGVDVPFLRVHMPLVAQLLSHRHCDSSAMKAAVPFAPWPKEDEATKHTAGADIDHAIACVRFARQVFREWSMVTSEFRPTLGQGAFGYYVEQQDGTDTSPQMDLDDAVQELFAQCLGRKPASFAPVPAPVDSGRVLHDSVHELSITGVDLGSTTEVTVSYSMDGGAEQSFTFDASDDLDLDVPSADLEAEYVAAIESGAESTPVALAEQRPISGSHASISDAGDITLHPDPSGKPIKSKK